MVVLLTGIAGVLLTAAAHRSSAARPVACGPACYDFTGRLAGIAHGCTCAPEHCTRSTCEEGGGFFIEENCTAPRPCPCVCDQLGLSEDEFHTAAEPLQEAEGPPLSDLGVPQHPTLAQPQRQLQQPAAEPQCGDNLSINTRILDMMNDASFDLGSVGPRVLRYSFHATGHWDPDGIPVGGSNGGSIRLEPERSYDDNLGFDHVETELLAIAGDFPECSAADVIVLAGYLAIQQLGGPTIPFCPGRMDFPEGSGATSCPMAGRLPHVSSTPAQLRETFGRMGCDDRCIVALIGAHSVGSTHSEISGFPNMPWNDNPFEFDNKVRDSTNMSMCSPSAQACRCPAVETHQDAGVVPTPHAFATLHDRRVPVSLTIVACCISSLSGCCWKTGNTAL